MARKRKTWVSVLDMDSAAVQRFLTCMNKLGTFVRNNE